MRTPGAAISAAVRASASSLISASARLQPRRAKDVAIARPIPLAAPVTTAVRPLRLSKLPAPCENAHDARLGRARLPCVPVARLAGKSAASLSGSVRQTFAEQSGAAPSGSRASKDRQDQELEARTAIALISMSASLRIKPATSTPVAAG